METPILYIIFSRIEIVKQVFEVIKQVKPKYFYIACDGYRPHIENEKSKNEIVKKYVIENINWECQVSTYFRDENEGPGLGNANAINWFFTKVEYGIIIEEDALPSISFFYFAEKLLQKYINDKNIYHITAYNPLGNLNIRQSYYFSRIEHCWAFATWKRAWDKYSYTFEGINDSDTYKKILRIFNNKLAVDYFFNCFINTKNGKINTWDYQWTYTILKNNGICINPSKNLVTNIGYSEEGTYCTDPNSKYSNLKRYEINTIIHPSRVKVNKKYLNKINYLIFGIKRERKLKHFFDRVRDKIKYELRKAKQLVRL